MVSKSSRMQLKREVSFKNSRASSSSVFVIRWIGVVSVLAGRHDSARSISLVMSSVISSSFSVKSTAHAFAKKSLLLFE